MRSGRKMRMNGKGWAGVLLWALVWVAWAQNADFQSGTGVRIPEYDEQGHLKSLMFCDLVKSLPDGNIEITGLKVEFYEGTQVTMRVMAPLCIFDRARNTAQSEGPAGTSVAVGRGRMVVTGTGFLFNNKDERFKILKDVKVVLKGGRRELNQGMLP